MRISFDELDELTEPEADALISELAAADASAVVSATERQLGMVEAAMLVTELSVIVVNLGVVATVVARIRDRFKRGMILDLRGPEPTMKPDRRLPLGSLYILHPDGSGEQIAAEEAATALSSLPSAVKGTAFVK